MNETLRYKFGIKPIKQPCGAWSFGCCLSHGFGETYLFINFAVWSISIGWLIESEEQ